MADYADARGDIEDGDIALFRNGGLIGIFQPWTHAAICVWKRSVEGEPTTLLLAESREWHGGRIVTLSSQVRKYPGRIDIFRPQCSEIVKQQAVELACRQAGRPYGWWSIAIAAAMRLTVVRLLGLYRPNTTDTRMSGWDTPKHCSQLVAWCYRKAARQTHKPFDLVPNKGDRYTEPSDIAQSGSVQLMVELSALEHKRAA